MWRVQKVNRHCNKVPVRWHVGPSTNMREYFWKSKNMNVTYLELKKDILQEICGNWRHLNLFLYKSQHAELLLLMLTFTKTNFRLWQFVIKGADPDGQFRCFLSLRSSEQLKTLKQPEMFCTKKKTSLESFHPLHTVRWQVRWQVRVHVSHL